MEYLLLDCRSADALALMQRSLQHRLSHSAVSNILVQHFAILARFQIDKDDDPTPWIAILRGIKEEIVVAFTDKAGWSSHTLYPPSFVLNIFIQMQLQERKFCFLITRPSLQ